MEKRVLLTELVDRGTHLRKEITPTATITDNGKYPAGTFWDANKTLNEIVAGATDALDTLKEVEDKLNKEISDARKAEQDIKDQIDDILGIDAQDIADLKQIVEDLDPETGILSVIDAKANTSDLGTAAYKDVAASGNASNTQVVMGNDTRLTDARIPLTHTHSYNDLTNKPDLSLKANVSDISVSMSSTNNHDYVEIAGVKWATMNVGASTESDRGLYFAWGDTTGYAASDNHSFKLDNYVFFGGGDINNWSTTKYNSSDNKTVLELEDDSANYNWDGKWRIPTSQEWQSLIDATTQEIVNNYNNSGVNVAIFTDKTNNANKLVIPTTGSGYQYTSNPNINSTFDYWCSNIGSYTKYARIFRGSTYLEDSFDVDTYGRNRYLGLPIRAVFTGDDTYDVLGKTVTDAEKSAWNAKADASNYYTKAEIDLMFANL